MIRNGRTPMTAALSKTERSILQGYGHWAKRWVLKRGGGSTTTPSLKYFVLKSLRVGVRTNPPDWSPSQEKE